MIKIGDRFDTYDITAILGRGGMGEVYRAHDTKLNRDVAIKFLSSEQSSAESRRRFQREVKVASSLNHPHILTVHDTGEFNGSQYLVTEFVDGGTLKDWLGTTAKHRRTWRQVVELLTGVVDGLAAAHDAGILHRDIKPENILVAKSGYAKLADFGLATLAERIGPDDPTLSEGHTRPGTILGTVRYMSPEQASGRPLDSRSDVFSFGIVLYEALAGRRPFAGDSETEVLHAIIRDAPAPLDADIPQGLRALIEKALEKDPADRYQTMRDMVVDLKRLTRQTGETAVSQAAAPGSKKRFVYQLGLAVAVIVLAAAAVFWMTRPPAVSAVVRSIAVIPLQNLSGDSSQEYLADGTTEALTSSLGRIHSLKVISRTSVMRYKGSTKTLPDIGRELGVDAIIEGSVHKIGERVRITAQLIQVASDAHLWAKDYEGDLGGMLQFEQDVAKSIAQEIRAQLTPQESTRFTTVKSVNPAAQDEFLMGTEERWKAAPGSFTRAIAHFQNAIRLQPDYAAAHAGFSNALLQAAFANRLEEARSSAQKALQLDPDSSDAHAAMGRVYAQDWKWKESREEFGRAFELNPGSLDACQCFPIMLFIDGRLAEATGVLEKALEMNPLSPDIQAAYGQILYFARKYDEALPHFQRAIDLDAKHFNALYWMANALEMKGDLSQATQFWNRAAAVSALDPVNSATSGRILVKLGRTAEARKVLAEILKPGVRLNLQTLASFYFALGDKENGFKALSKVFDEKQNAQLVALDPLFDDVRNEPRMQALIARLNFPRA